jgi:hypothetical protein
MKQQDRKLRVTVDSEVTVGRNRRECGRCGSEGRVQVHQLSKAGGGAIRRVNDTASQGSNKIAVAQWARIAGLTARNSITVG